MISSSPTAPANVMRSALGLAEDRVHLASCSYAPPWAGLEASMRAMLAAMGAAAWEVWEYQVEQLRDRVAASIDAGRDQIALIADVTTGAFQAASTVELTSRRPKIVAASAEFAGVMHVWMAQRGAELVIVGDRDGRVSAEDYLRAIDTRTALVSVPVVSYRDGVRLPVREIAAAAHRVGARVFVDAYQAFGVEPLSVRQLWCDWLVTGFGKYTLGLPGVAAVYEREVGARQPVLTGWQGRCPQHRWDPWRLDWPHTARRLQAGTPAVPAVYAANAGLSLLSELDLRAVRRHVTMLVGHARQRLRDAGVTVSTPVPAEEHGAHLAVRESRPEMVARWLADRQVAVAPRGGVVRLAMHAFVTVAEVDRACHLIAELHAREARRSAGVA
ncbi:aminotransferase class V-fold PLP-dependent enzyme [Micromonospora sp. WMMA1363]|uniref:aminotransferase class V-fold PLP-dependent enzyme n=1 Tax=Micromonospora sp. WMMA1363 TaxID=3053985 RepID=UPI00259CE254|nr:aminotransferase class V-fold PLP-dependent enzyme [Micromonospora sp. WMMA1363]MDM4723310.1 aminotransferase class V-fold PLP-dependent enzyme [Micromonospora sp. WMMA1363]